MYQVLTMKNKTVTQLDAEGYFVGLALADESPLEPGVFLIPGGAVDAPAPEVPEGQRARWSGAGFVLEAIPQPKAPEPPPPPARADVIRGRLYQIDAESVRALRATVSATGKGKPAPAFDVDKLVALEAEASALRAELAALGA